MSNNQEERVRHYVQEAEERCKRSDYEGAIRSCDKAIEIDPNFVGAYINRGIANSEMERYKEAITDYDKAIKIDPSIVQSHFNRGNTNGRLKRYEEAIADYDKALEIEPNLTDAYINRGDSKAYLKRYDEALADYDRAIEIDSNLVRAYRNRAVIKTELKRYEEVIADYNRIIEINPNDTEAIEAYNGRGYVKTILERYEEAIANYDKAIEIDPNLAEAYNNRGAVKLELKRYDEAITDLNRAIEIDPNNTAAYDNLSLLSYKQGRLKPEYLYIPFLNYTWFSRMTWITASVIIGFFLSLCGLGGETLLDIVPISAFFVLTGFFLIAFEIGHKNTRFDEDDARATFEILLKSFIMCIAIFGIGKIHIVELFVSDYISVFKNILGSFYIILLYVLINRMRSIFIDISTYTPNIKPSDSKYSEQEMRKK